MIKILFAILFSVNIVWPACTKINMPTDYSIVANGTRANLKANFDETQTKVNPCMDSVDQVRGRFDGYTGSFSIYSLENLRLRLDTDASTTGRLSVENSNGDSLFRVSEDSSAKVFGALAVAGVATLTTAPVLSALTASLPVFTNGSKALASNTMTGTGSVVMSASPTFTGTIGAADATLSGNLTLSAIPTGRIPYTTTAGQVTSGTGLTYNGSAFGVTGTADISGNFAINTNKFNVTAASGNTAIAGIISVAGSGVALDINSAQSGTTLSSRIYNTSNTASSDARQILQVGGYSARDPYTNYSNSVVEWSTGMDNSDAQAYTISYNGPPGTSNALKITTGGAVTIPGTLGVTGVTTATGGLTLGASFVDKTTSLTSNTTLTSAHSTIFASASGGSFTITLPTAVGNTGLTYKIFKTDNTTNLVTIDGNGSQTVGGELTQALCGNTNNSVIKIISDGSNWELEDIKDEGSFTGTLTGTTGGSGTIYFIRNKNNVVLDFISTIYATSNSTACTITGMPTPLAPITAKVLNSTAYNLSDNSAPQGLNNGYFIKAETSGVLTLYASYSTTGFTASGLKGFMGALPYNTAAIINYTRF
jgi:hypothetical protein